MGYIVRGRGELARSFRLFILQIPSTKVMPAMNALFTVEMIDIGVFLYVFYYGSKDAQE